MNFPIFIIFIKFIGNNLSKAELIEINVELRREIGQKNEEINDLRDYIDRLLARIMEKNPEMLEALSC